MKTILALLVFSVAWSLSLFAFSADAAHSETIYQRYADSLCFSLKSAYGGPQPGWKVTFKACKPAGYDRVAQMENYWVWYAVVHRGRVSLNVVKIDPAGNPIEGPYTLTPYEYNHLQRPDPALTA